MNYAKIAAIANDAKRIMVVLDSDHTRDHVLAEMRLYGPLVTEGCYMIVEDSNINGHPVRAEFGPGPAEAIEQFAFYASEYFMIDRVVEHFPFTYHPGGYLRKIKGDTAWRISKEKKT